MCGYIRNTSYASSILPLNITKSVFPEVANGYVAATTSFRDNYEYLVQDMIKNQASILLDYQNSTCEQIKTDSPSFSSDPAVNGETVEERDESDIPLIEISCSSNETTLDNVNAQNCTDFPDDNNTKLSNSNSQVKLAASIDPKNRKNKCDDNEDDLENNHSKNRGEHLHHHDDFNKDIYYNSNKIDDESSIGNFVKAISSIVSPITSRPIASVTASTTTPAFGLESHKQQDPCTNIDSNGDFDNLDHNGNNEDGSTKDNIGIDSNTNGDSNGNDSNDSTNDFNHNL
eukprot:Awhi_evm1s3658